MVTLDFFDTLVFHRDGRGRGRTLFEYLERHGFEPAPWDHAVLYDVFAVHHTDYSPDAPRPERHAYYCRLARRVFERLSIHASDDIADRHAEALWQLLGPECFGVFPDALEALEALRARGIPVAIVSNWQCGLAHFCTELGLAGFIHHVLSSAEVDAEKPDARIFHEACTRLRVPPARTLHIGDTYLEDYVGGEAAGLQVALIDRSGTSDAPSARTISSLLSVVDLVSCDDD